MDKRNYNEISTPSVVDVEDSILELEVEEQIHDVEIEDPAPIIGIVVGCKKLNVRRRPDINSEVVCEVANTSELLIDMDGSTNGWFKVCTAAGSEGFCMKDFVEVQ